MQEQELVVLGLGSNVGDREAHLRAAISALLPLIVGMRVSTVMETPALLPEGAPPEWDVSYLNLAVCGHVSLSPRALLDEMKRIEREGGRQDRGRWGPREIDIDILAYGERRIQEADLEIPHRGLFTRDFAHVPFAEIAPELLERLRKA